MALSALVPSPAHALPDPPGGVEDLVLWLDASDPNGDGTTPTAGTAISTWKDLSGSGLHAVAESGSEATWQPAPTGFNGKPALRFTRINDTTGSIYKASLNIQPATTPDLTVIALYLPVNNSTVQYGANGIWGSDDGNWDRFFLSYYQEGASADTDGLVGLGPDSGGETITGSQATGGSPHLMTVAYSGNVSGSSNIGLTDGSYVYFNCELVRVFTDSTHPTDAKDYFGIGWDGDTSAFDGYIAELLVYDRVLLANEVNAVNAYLATKYSLQSACSSFIEANPDPIFYREQVEHLLEDQGELPKTGSSPILPGLAALMVLSGALMRLRSRSTRKNTTTA